jgi:leader peptidase (prepilin peptidase) / N-methyltransferase
MNAVQMEARLRPNLGIVLGGSVAVVIVSFASLSWQEATASTVLGALMLAGADIDARTYLLPNTITFGTIGSGILLGPLMSADSAWLAIGMAVVRALGTAGVLELVRRAYIAARGQEGLGFGDVKLAAGIGAWLPLEAIPICFGLATIGALVSVLLSIARGQKVQSATKLPLGAYLCPALWLVFYAGVLAG